MEAKRSKPNPQETLVQVAESVFKEVLAVGRSADEKALKAAIPALETTGEAFLCPGPLCDMIETGLTYPEDARIPAFFIRVVGHLGCTRDTWTQLLERHPRWAATPLVSWKCCLKDGKSWKEEDLSEDSLQRIHASLCCLEHHWSHETGLAWAQREGVPPAEVVCIALRHPVTFVCDAASRLLRVLLLVGDQTYLDEDALTRCLPDHSNDTEPIPLHSTMYFVDALAELAESQEGRHVLAQRHLLARLLPLLQDPSPVLRHRVAETIALAFHNVEACEEEEPVLPLARLLPVLHALLHSRKKDEVLTALQLLGAAAGPSCSSCSSPGIDRDRCHLFGLLTDCMALSEGESVEEGYLQIPTTDCLPLLSRCTHVLLQGGRAWLATPPPASIQNVQRWMQILRRRLLMSGNRNDEDRIVHTTVETLEQGLLWSVREKDLSDEWIPSFQALLMTCDRSTATRVILRCLESLRTFLAQTALCDKFVDDTASGEAARTRFITVILRRLVDGRWEVRDSAVGCVAALYHKTDQALMKFARSFRGVNQLVHRVQDEDGYVRAAALNALMVPRIPSGLWEFPNNNNNNYYYYNVRLQEKHRLVGVNWVNNLLDTMACSRHLIDDFVEHGIVLSASLTFFTMLLDRPPVIAFLQTQSEAFRTSLTKLVDDEDWETKVLCCRFCDCLLDRNNMNLLLLLGGAETLISWVEDCDRIVRVKACQVLEKLRGMLDATPLRDQLNHLDLARRAAEATPMALYQEEFDFCGSNVHET